MAAIHVKRLSRDTADPSRFRERLGGWEKRGTEAGAAESRTFPDARKLPEYLEEVRG